MSTNAHFENGTLTMTRVYDAPRESVFDSWVQTSKVEQWWGCEQTTNVKSEIECQVGGKFNHLMTIEGAGEYPMQARFVEFDPPNRLAYEVPGNEHMPVAMLVTVEFSTRGNQTEVKLVHNNLPDTLSDIVKGGWTAALRKLGELLERELAESN